MAGKRHRCELTKLHTLLQAPGRMSISRGTELSSKLTKLYKHVSYVVCQSRLNKIFKIMLREECNGMRPPGTCFGIGDSLPFTPVLLLESYMLSIWLGFPVCFVLLLILGLGLLTVDRFPRKETHSFSEDMATAGFLYSSECLTPTHSRAL